MNTTLPIPEFFEGDPEAIVQALIAQYQTASGRVVQDAQAERLVFNAVAYSIALHEQKANWAAKQMLARFSTFPVLDYIAEPFGVIRLLAKPALTTLEFNLVPGHSGVVIPEGTRVQSEDGEQIFRTLESVSVPAGTNVVTTEAECSVTGATGNGFIPGSLTEILDPQPFLASASNITTTAGGVDDESDSNMRERLYLAPDSFSTAGSEDAYKFHARSASQLIVDVAVTNPIPGTVHVYPMVSGGGTTPPEILEAVELACSGEKVRPINDTVVAVSPTTIYYSIEVNLTLYANAQQPIVTSAVTANLTAFKNEKGKRLGQDIILNQIRGQCTSVEGVYNVAVVQPAADIIVSDTQVAICLGVIVNVTGLNDG